MMGAGNSMLIAYETEFDNSGLIIFKDACPGWILRCDALVPVDTSAGSVGQDRKVYSNSYKYSCHE